MEDMTDSVREALQGVTYESRNAPHLDSPQDDSPTITTLITDPGPLYSTPHTSRLPVGGGIGDVWASGACSH